MKSKKLISAILAAASIAGGVVGVQAQTVEGLESKVDSYTSRVQQAEKRIGTLETKVKALDTTGIADNKAKIEAEATARTDADKKHDQKISALEKKTDKHDWKIDTLEKKTGVNTPLTNGATNLSAGVNENTRKIDAEATARENAVNKLQNQVTAATGRLDNVTNKVTQNADAIGTLQEQVKKSGAAYVAKQSEQIETNKNDIGTIFGQLDQGAYNQKDGYVVKKDDTIGGALKNLDKNADKQHWQIDALEKKTGVNTPLINGAFSLSDGVNANTGKINENTSKIDANTGKINALDKTVDKQHWQIDALEKKTGVNTPLTNGATNLSAGVNENTRKIDAEETARKAAVKAEEDERIAGDNMLNSRINQVESDATKGIAKASALAALHPLDYDPDNKFDIAAAGGFYKGENAFALGAFYRPNRNVMLSMGTTLTGGDNAYNVGLTFKIGKSGKHTEAGLTTADLYAMIGAMQDKMDQQQKKIEELEAKQAK